MTNWNLEPESLILPLNLLPFLVIFYQKAQIVDTTKTNKFTQLNGFLGGIDRGLDVWYVAIGRWCDGNSGIWGFGEMGMEIYNLNVEKLTAY